MVRGNIYGVQYEIYLNKEVDLFNDILPICVDVRKMISLEKNNNRYKLVVIPYKELDKRFQKREIVSKYTKIMNSICTNRQITRKNNPDMFKYYDVKNYTTHVKHSQDVEPYTDEMFEKLETRVRELSSIYNEFDYWEKYSSEERNNIDTERCNLMDVLKVQRIVKNKDYFDEIKEIEQELTNVELTCEEKKLIINVLGHPKLEGIVDSYGVNLFNELASNFTIF